MITDQDRMRIYAVMAVMSAAGLVLIGQLIRWQIIEHPQFVALAEAEHRDELVIPPRRGEIRDRSHHILAADVIEYNISASPEIISRPQEVSQKLADLLGRSQGALYDLLTSDAAWVPIAQNVPQQVGETIIAWDYVGLIAESRAKRVYPEGFIAAHLLGFVNSNGNGFYGLEGYYDQILRGKPGIQAGERSPFGEIIPLGVTHYAPPIRGATLYLTVDRGIELLLNRELEQAVINYGAQRGSAIVMNPRTGAILGMASYPAYDPNNYGDSDERLYFDPNVSEQYEPGSVFKIVTMAAGLDAGVVQSESTIYDGGQIEVGGRTIYNWDRQGHGTVDMTGVLAKSLNVGVAQIAVKLGKDRFYNYIRRFGFGQLTAVDLDSEGPGTLKTPKDATWHESDLGTNSFGQGIAVTPLQMITAIAAIANDGLLMKPHVVGRVVDHDREIIIEPTVIRRSVSAETAQILSHMMVQSMQDNDSEGMLPGYEVAGKTGTAQIPVPGGYHPTLTIASFVGFFPVDDPQVVILVNIDRPTTSRWGSQTAAPTFRSIAEQLVILLDMPPNDLELAQR